MDKMTNEPAPVEIEADLDDAFDAELARLAGDQDQSLESEADEVHETPDASEAAEEAATTADGGEGAAPKGEAPAAGDDPWAGLPDHLRERVEALAHSARSDSGRVAAMQRQMQEMERRLEEMTRRPHATGKDGAPAAPLDLDQELRSVVEDYPDIAGPFVKIIEQQQAKLDRMDRYFSELENQQIAANISAVEQEHDDYRAFMQEHWDRFSSWIEHDAPVRLRRAFEANARACRDPRAVSEVLTEFKAFAGLAEAKAPAGSDNPPSAPNQNATRRQRQLAAAASPSTSGRPLGASAGTVPADDEEAAFEMELARLKARDGSRAA